MTTTVIKEEAKDNKPVAKKMTQPWKPMSVLHVNEKYKSPEFKLCWVRIDNLDVALESGWEIVKGKRDEISPMLTLVDGTQLTNIIRKRGQVLCRMPAAMFEEKEAFYRSLGNDFLKTENAQFVKKIAEPVNPAGDAGKAYGKIEMTIGEKEGVNG